MPSVNLGETVRPSTPESGLGWGAEGLLERNQGGEPGTKRDSSTEILGRYALLAEIATGELTSVHLARQHGDSGFRRLVALKRLKPLFARQPECVQLLVDEAKLTSGLHHANVIGCLDMGMEGGCYVVQNYVEGDNLQNLLQRAGTESHPRYVVPLIVDVLNGLHAVHTALDGEGVPLGLVHQAPHARHVLVGIDGIARLTDFTQAKACTVAPTRQRSDRLKIANMAPEQALNPEAVDHRADLFLMGVLLWESLTGERLFAAESEEQTFQNVLHRRILRPSEVGRKPARCFDAICLRALERDPAKRYRSSLDMARELRDTALNQALYATTGEIGQWVKALAGPKLIERRRLAGNEPSAEEDNTGPLPEASSSSGFFQSTQRADPYGSGLIFGGSFSRLDPNTQVDPDKTPAIGTRALLNAAPREERKRDDEPTARHSTPPERLRKSTEPYWPIESASRDSQPTADAKPQAQRVSSWPPPKEPFAPAPSLTVPKVELPMAPLPVAPAPAEPPPAQFAPITPSQTPTTVTRRSLAEQARPDGFVPARPGAVREEGVKSPGAYIQVAPARKRTSSPQAARPSEPGATAATEGPRSTPAPAAPLAGGMAVRPSAPPLAGRRISNTDGLAARQTTPKPRAAVDAPSNFDLRSDSTPTRLLVPAGPVGSPYRDASASKAPQAFELPPMPKALNELTGRTRSADVLHVPVDSLAPSVLSAGSVPPEPSDDPAPKSSRSMWLVTGLLAAIILLAAIVSVRNRLQRPEPVRVTAAQPATPAAPPVSAPAVQKAPEVLAPPAAPPTAESATQAAQPLSKPAQDAPKPTAPKQPWAPGTKPASPSVPGAAAAKPGAEVAPQLPAKPSRPRAKNPLPIPDNPY